MTPEPVKLWRQARDEYPDDAEARRCRYDELRNEHRGSDPPPTQVLDALKDLADMMQGRGVHAEHTQEQSGRCVYCSCGLRVQGELQRKDQP